MIAELVETWRLTDGRLLSADINRGSYPTADIETALDHATDAMSVETDDPEGYAIPLFDPDTPKPTAEFVVYRPEREQLGWHDTSFGVGGTERFTDASDLAATEIGHRLRFWIPENRPGISAAVTDDDLPPRSIEPSDPLDSDATADFFDGLLDFVRSERDSELVSNQSSFERHDPEKRLHRPEVTGPFERIGGIDRSAERSGTGRSGAGRSGAGQSGTGRSGAGQSGAEGSATSRSADTGGPDDGTYRYRLPGVSPGHVDLRGDHSLFAGNWCLADAQHPAFPIPVRLSAVEDPHVSVQPQWERIDDSATVRDRLAEGERLWLAPLLNPVPFDRRLAGIESVRADERKRELLTGNRSLRFSANRYDLPESDVDLNRHQHDALIWADGADDVVCLHGPPGTGKSRTLTAYVQCAVENGQSVLVTAHSNQAVDNLLVGESSLAEPEPQTLHAFAQRGDLSVARLGQHSRNAVVEREYVGESVAAADVVAATTSGAAAFDTDEFDVAVVDEATQASRPATLIAFDAARKLVLAGDHRQLPPYTADETTGEEALRPSLFETLLDRYGEAVAVTLRRQYRMNETIAEFPSRAFYDGWLETADRNRTWTVGDRPPVAGIDVSGTERQHSGGYSYRNDREAEVVAAEVAELLDALDPTEIGVVTPYTAQQTAIRESLAGHETIGGSDAEQVAVDTVDSVQGSEREAVVVSFVRSNDDGESGFLSFPEEGPRRLNVALTRARKRLVLVGNWDTLSATAGGDGSTDSCAGVYAELADWLREAGQMRSVGGE